MCLHRSIYILCRQSCFSRTGRQATFEIWYNCEKTIKHSHIDTHTKYSRKQNRKVTRKFNLPYGYQILLDGCINHTFCRHRHHAHQKCVWKSMRKWHCNSKCKPSRISRIITNSAFNFVEKVHTRFDQSLTHTIIHLPIQLMYINENVD